MPPTTTRSQANATAEEPHQEEELPPRKRKHELDEEEHADDNKKIKHLEQLHPEQLEDQPLTSEQDVNATQPETSRGSDESELDGEQPEEDEYTLKRKAAIAALLAEEEAEENGSVNPLENKTDTRVIPVGASRDVYLDTVNRHMLDFDFEKLCSVSLSDMNVYGCLVCGKYFQGRGKNSHAYFHSIHDGHHVYVNLHTLKVFVLPDGYEVVDSSLDDIKYVLKPSFTEAQVAKLDSNASFSYDLNNKKYLPGFVGLNNIKANDYVNVIIQALAHIPELRDYFILTDLDEKSQLAQRFGNLLRKIWNPKAFKGQVSPHELLQAISTTSKKRFRSTQQADTVDFLSWFLNALHKDLGGTRKHNSSIIHKCFQGEVRVETQTIGAPKDDEARDNMQIKEFDTEREITTVTSPFLYLTLDLPPPPLFQDEVEKNIIPQVPLTSLLQKFDGRSAQESQGVLRRYRITQLPNYLLFHIRRFSKNNWAVEKNPTIVNFPIRDIDMAEYVDNPPSDISTRYDLIANIVHEGGVADKNGIAKKKGALKIGGTAEGQGVYKVHVQHKARDQWYHIQDLFVEEVMPQMIFLSESYLQVWGRSTTS